MGPPQSMTTTEHMGTSNKSFPLRSIWNSVRSDPPTMPKTNMIETRGNPQSLPYFVVYAYSLDSAGTSRCAPALKEKPTPSYNLLMRAGPRACYGRMRDEHR